MNKNFLAVGALFGALSVALGAFAAHALKSMLPADAVAVFETGVRYQFYHAVALLVIGILSEKFSQKKLRWAGNCFIAGIILFSGSLYAITVLRIAETIGAIKYIGIITPFGGLSFIAGWLLLFFAVSKPE
jgi:uncharacterized membrane protein YgdD (TMEM256/DUF423 family)